MTMGFEPAAAPRDLLLCLSHLRWNFVLQRPQHLLLRAAKHFQVIFFEEPEFTDGVEPDLRLQRHEGVLVATPVMSPQERDPDRVIKAQLERLVAPFQNGRSVIWYCTPMAVPFARDIEADCIVYDCMDELSAFLHAPRQLRGLKQELLASCDLVFTGGDSLYEATRQHHPQTHCFPSGSIANLPIDPDPAWLEAVDRQLGRSSSDETWGRMHALIETILQPDPITPPMVRELERSLHV